jgi:hypothetical protein
MTVELTQKIVRELLDYDPATGELTLRPPQSIRASLETEPPGECALLPPLWRVRSDTSGARVQRVVTQPFRK